LAAAGVLVAAAAGGALFLRHPSSSSLMATADVGAQSAIGEAPGSEASVSNSPRIGVPARATREVHFVLSPIDSHLFRGDEDLGPMPVSVQVEEGTSMTLTVRRKGYNTRKVVVDGTDTRVVVGLIRAEPPQSSLSKATNRRKF
jgi:hypothetical protein